jgi:tRNA threonylcarbamoyladenosine biosynthesis protein TsaE
MVRRANDWLDSHDPGDTRRIGEQLGRWLEGGEVIALEGDLGAGKTCFVQGLALGLGVDPSVPVTSPTFTLVGEYPGRLALRHADFYRVESYARLDDAGFDDLVDPRGVLVVEWPQRFPDAIPRDRLDVRIEVVSESSRRIHVSGVGERARALARRLLETWR